MIELAIGVMSAVRPREGLLDRDPDPTWARESFGDLMSIFFSMHYSSTVMVEKHSIRVRTVGKISSLTIYKCIRVSQLV